jgi:hypothetical protein
MLKLKTNKTSINGLKTKMRNQKNKDWSRNTNNKEGQAVIFSGGKIKEKECPLVTNRTTNTDRRHSVWKRTRWKDIFKCLSPSS